MPQWILSADRQVLVNLDRANQIRIDRGDKAIVVEVDAEGGRKVVLLGRYPRPENHEQVLSGLRQMLGAIPWNGDENPE